MESIQYRSILKIPALIRAIGICTYLCLTFFVANAQSISKDSTKQLLAGLRREQPDSLKIKSLIHLGNYIADKEGAGKQQIDSAAVFYNKGLKLARTIRSLKWGNKCLRAITKNNYNGRYDTTGAHLQYTNLISSFRRAGDVAGEAECWADFGELLIDHAKSFSEALVCFERQKQLYQKINDKLGENRALKQISLVHRQQGQLKEALEEMTRAYSFFRISNNLKEQVSCEIQLANIYWKLGNTQQALYFNSEALKTAKSIKDDYWMVIATNSLGRQYYDLKMYAEALPHLESSLAFTKKLNSRYNYSIALLSVIDNRVKLGKTQGLLRYLTTADQVMPAVNDMDKLNIYCAYGLVYQSMQNPVEAEKWFLKTIETFDKLEKKKAFGSYGQLFMQTYYKSIGDFYMSEAKFQKARLYFEKLEQLSPKVKTPLSESEIQIALYKIDSASGKYINSIRHLQNYNQIHDSLYNANSANQIANLKARYLADQRAKDLVIMKGRQKSQAMIVKNANLQRDITLAGIITVSLLAGLSYWAYRKKQYVYSKLELQGAQIDDQNVSLRKLLEEKETLLTEKDWLIKEVHHRVKNNLQLITSLLNQQSASSRQTDVLEAIKISRNRIQAISLIHLKLSNGSNLASLNIRSYVSELINNLQDAFNPSSQLIKFTTSIEPIQIELAQAIPIGLILNEAITNSIKYAFDATGSEISITLQHVTSTQVMLQIADNGRGIPASIDPTSASSLGFKIMRALSAQLRGDLRIENKEGTLITIQFPLKKLKDYGNTGFGSVSQN
ncbi:tetratricopeptide repeat protein [Dyadobacter chenwenxiniae]|uniref:histidine kinase n=1 Tax=Dyadobacter chenwenxiniae TaxID=2906456 RepID=A0A9X1PNP1_9BACT|nr:histidine kinase dimerization/phosphoacceptor domain -containing protein [Dyadobacter chenwenxiniae]MCF0064732.1 tetratricopeptide repeat protein [Dyadobacter chenwenxiniae]UON84214.1 tetratricopeptide repeat protein [Dyadobacter chenwenxiniae]